MDENGTGKSSKMIDTKELRIGNWVDTPDGQKTVKTIYRGAISDVEHVYNETRIMGIPLTQEWLERLGFELRGKKWVIKDSLGYSALHIYAVAGTLVYGVSWNYNVSETIDLTTIEFVHELQNIHHALTGQELKTN